MLIIDSFKDLYPNKQIKRIQKKFKKCLPTNLWIREQSNMNEKIGLQYKIQQFIYMRFLIVVLLLSCAQFTLSITYNSSQSQIFQRYTIITHCTHEELINWSCKSCQTLQKLSNFKIIENKIASIMTYVGYSKVLDRIIIVFRGTVDAKNWIEDFSYKQVAYKQCKNCQIHEGFYLSYLSVGSQINLQIDFINKLYGNKNIIVLGASLGGALAMVAGIEIQLKYSSVQEIHTFGCPRVGNQQFSMFLKTRVPTWRVVHNRDIVPHVPLVSQNFFHPPFEVLYDQHMESYKICGEIGEDQSCSNGYYPNFSVEDHVSYWTKLNVHDICS